MKEEIKQLLSEDNIKNIIQGQEERQRMYHYTTMETFFKIVDGIKNDCFKFRAGSVYTMNDRQEIVLGYEKIKKYLPQVEEILHVANDEKISILLSDTQKNNEIADRFGKWMINDDYTNFVVSFSASPDILPMWTLYGGNGTGVCLEFSPYLIEDYYKDKKERRMQIEHCVYEDSDIESFLLKKLEVLYRLYLRSNEDKKVPLVKAKHLAVMCGLVGAFVKHSCFEYEQEIRWNIFKNKQYWQFTETRHHNISAFVDVDIPINALTGIIVGPVASMDNAKNSMIMILRTKDIRIEPVQSNVPFRLR